MPFVETAAVLEPEHINVGAALMPAVLKKNLVAFHVVRVDGSRDGPVVVHLFNELPLTARR